MNIFADLTATATPNVVGAKAQKVQTLAMADLWTWQQDFVRKVAAAPCIYLNSPTGSGKSRPIIYLCAKHVAQGGKALIVVPNRDIAANFRNPVVGKRLHVKTGHGVVDWAPREFVQTKRVERLRTFLSAAGGGVVIATHQALALLAREIEQQPRLLNNVFLVIDEAHHVRDDTDSLSGQAEWSRLGLVAQVAVTRATTGRRKSRGRIALVTATPFRGDRRPVLDEAVVAKKFVRYTRTMQEHLRESKINDVRFHLVTYRGNVHAYVPAVKRIYQKLKPELKDRVGVVWMPHTSSKYNRVGGRDAFMDKDVQRKALLRALVQCGRAPSDWVGANQDAAKQSFAEARAKGRSEKVDTYVAMNLFQEGTDDARIDHAISIGYQGSFTRMVHRMGRTTRRHPGKHETHIFLVLPLGHSPSDAVEFNRFLKTMCMVFIGQEIFVVRQPLDAVADGTGDGTVPRDTRPATDRLGAIMAAKDAMAAAALVCEKDAVTGEPTPKGIADVHAAGVEAAVAFAAAQGATKVEQTHTRHEAQAIMPRLLHYMAIWFSDDIEASLVELSTTNYHRSRPLAGKTLRAFSKLVVEHHAHVRAEAALAVEGWVRRNCRMPSRSKTDTKERQIFDHYTDFTNTKHTWYRPDFKARLKKIRDVAYMGTSQTRAKRKATV